MLSLFSWTFPTRVPEGSVQQAMHSRQRRESVTRHTSEIFAWLHSRGSNVFPGMASQKFRTNFGKSRRGGSPSQSSFVLLLFLSSLSYVCVLKTKSENQHERKEEVRPLLPPVPPVPPDPCIFLAVSTCHFLGQKAPLEILLRMRWVCALARPVVLLAA